MFDRLSKIAFENPSTATCLLQDARRNVGERDGLVGFGNCKEKIFQEFVAACAETRHTFTHVLDDDAALNNFLVGVEVLIVRSDEENHSFWDCE
jgi:hypothetical protein